MLQLLPLGTPEVPQILPWETPLGDTSQVPRETPEIGPPG